MWNSFNHHRHSAENTKEREKIYEKIKRKKKLGSLSLSLSLFLARARAHPSVFHWLILHIAVSPSLLHSGDHFILSFQSSPAFRMQKRTRAAPRNETREREKNEIQKKIRERESTTPTRIVSSPSLDPRERRRERWFSQKPVFVIIEYLSTK
jgi:hypothetical protein